MRPHRALKVHLKKNFSSFSKAFCQFYSYHFCLFFHFRNSYFLSYLDLGMILLFYPFFNFFLSFQPILILPISYHFGNLFNLFAIYAILLLTFYITFRHFTPIFLAFSSYLLLLFCFFALFFALLYHSVRIYWVFFLLSTFFKHCLFSAFFTCNGEFKQSSKATQGSSISPEFKVSKVMIFAKN